MARMSTTFNEIGPETFSGAGIEIAPDYEVFQRPGLHAQVRKLKCHEHLFFEGDEVSHFYEILDGVMCIYKLLPDGRRHVMSFGFSGDLIALSTHGEHKFSAEVIEPLTVRCIPKAMLATAINDNPDFARKVIDAATSELAEARDQVLTVSRRSAIERIASFLMGISRRNAKQGEDASVLKLPMTRLDIADFLGLTLETVSRTISKLKKMRVIDLPHSSLVVVRDMEELELLAEV
jgi:CRP-like cAMP-binding protein